jgi:8-oxo-dGTP diphosphatase
MSHAFDQSRPIDIRKSAGVIISDKKLVVTRSHGKDFFMAPGGKLETNETPEQALVRELHEELGINTVKTNFELLGTYYAMAGGQNDKQLEMYVYYVHSWSGNISAQAEIAEIRWVDSVSVKNIELTTIFRDDVLPLLYSNNLIN